MRVLVIANREDPETGFIGTALAARGAVFDQAWRDDDEPLPEVGRPRPGPEPRLGLVGLLARTGPRGGARAASTCRAVSRQVSPCSGSASAAQMLAQALGGRVEPAPLGGELGWFTIDTDVPDAIPPGPYLQWHSDCIVIPPDAVELARSPVGTQAFRLGQRSRPAVPPGDAARGRRPVGHRWTSAAGEPRDRRGDPRHPLPRRSRRSPRPGQRDRRGVPADVRPSSTNRGPTAGER